ncbi:MAG: DUF4332 domain-containing protein [Eubacteriales bacterium]|nr:DUF4332 domain-containing protein [Eubacteriales bacterium]MDD3882448.1 DUF4332 domain-containing protein [Eubacteriales bacterium]MDD4513170.1 DUF4332 domain-containing protein [Eubacteriales bacterium]
MPSSRISALTGISETVLRECCSLFDLMRLPGVKGIRARLYLDAGYSSITEFSKAAPDEVIKKTSAVIENRRLSLAKPLPKEVRTQLAVSKALPHINYRCME